MILVASTISCPTRREPREGDTKADTVPNSSKAGLDRMAMRRVLLVEDDDILRSNCQKFIVDNPNVPIIFLTERTEDHDRISGLRLGADDFLIITISVIYLTARINALIRRVETFTSAQSSAKVAAPREEDSVSSSLRIDERLSRAYWRTTPLQLSLTQFWILKDLVEHRGEVRSINDLMRAAHITVQPNTIVAQIKGIREQFQTITPEFACIKSERSRGYRWLEE